MINVLFAADFTIEKSGIASTASSILAEDMLGPTCIFSEQCLSINGSFARGISDLGGVHVNLVFTHAEYSGLAKLQQQHPDAIFHVGDWPLSHWLSVRRVQLIKGALATLRSHWRLRKVNRNSKLAFVTKEDCDSAITYGFSRAIHMPIGVKPPNISLSDKVDSGTVCFSGNFRYPPNRDAAQRLLKLANAKFPEFRVMLAGFYADDFQGFVGNNVEIHADVPSVVDFLALRRPIYVSLIETGAGAKNKILEAMVAGCPIICTPESLDSSIPVAASVKIVTCDEDVTSQLHEWGLSSSQNALALESGRVAEDTRVHRSWRSVAKITFNLIKSCSI